MKSERIQNLNKVKRECRIWATALLGTGESSDKLALNLFKEMNRLKEFDTVIVAIKARRMANISDGKNWLYLKPNHDKIVPDELSELQAAMLCLSPDTLDILLLRVGLNLSTVKISQILDLAISSDVHDKAMNTLVNLIDYEETANRREQLQVATQIIYDMCDEIKRTVEDLTYVENSHAPVIGERFNPNDDKLPPPQSAPLPPQPKPVPPPQPVQYEEETPPKLTRQQAIEKLMSYDEKLHIPISDSDEMATEKIVQQPISPIKTEQSNRPTLDEDKPKKQKQKKSDSYKSKQTIVNDEFEAPVFEELGEETSKKSKRKSKKKKLKISLMTAFILFVLIDGLAIGGYIYFKDDIDRLIGSTAIMPQNTFMHTLDNTAMNGLQLKLTYVPNGYYMAEHNVSSLSGRTVYRTGDGREIVFLQQVSNTEIKDYDDSIEYKLIEVNAKEYAYYMENGEVALTWFSGNYAYKLSGTVDISEITQMVSKIELLQYAVPYNYNEKVARLLGDVVSSDMTDYDFDKLDDFSQNEIDEIRICQPTQLGTSVITLQRLENGMIYYTSDTRRRYDSNNQIEVGSVYESMSIDIDGNFSTIMLMTQTGDTLYINL